MRAPDFWRRTGAGAGLAAALSPLSWIHGATVAYKAAHTKGYRACTKVICIGNLTVGGSGKTPVVRAVAQELTAQGLRVFILSRGYGGRLSGPVLVDPKQHSAAEVGDEPLMLATAAPVIVSRDRRAGAQMIAAHRADVIVMDDGHQNFSLWKDLSLVVINAAEGFGNGRVLPAGPLREPVAQGLARADAVVIMGSQSIPLPPFDGAVLRAHIVPDQSANFAGQRVIAFAGIGRPEKFFATLEELGATVVERKSFPDHHPYTDRELESLRARSSYLGAGMVTTEKDFVRISPVQRTAIGYLPVSVVFEDNAAFAGLLESGPPKTPVTRAA